MPALDFIFMLTRHDRTVADAAAHIGTALQAGVTHIGFKDVGLPFAALADLAARIREGGARTYLEIVSLDRDSELRSVETGLALGVDCLLGGTRANDVLPLIAGSTARYFPFPGRITGHPSVLEGDIDEIVASAAALTAHEGVAGLDLLAYRFAGDVRALIRTVCGAVTKPVIVAGSIDRPERIEAVREGGAASFTIGTCALEGRFPGASPGLGDQLRAIAACARRSETR